MSDKIQPVVSVLMTSYNREKYLAFAIESVLASTFTNWELIIVDDGSSDETVTIAKRYEEQDARIRVYQNEGNLGDYPNRNMAASYATGTYLKYIDADDYIYPWGLEILVNSMAQYPTAGWGLCSLPPDRKKPYPFELSPAEIYDYHNFTSPLFHKAPLSAIIKRSCFEAIGGFSGKQHLGDFELWHLLGLQHNLVLMPEGIVWYRIHDQQESVSNRSNITVKAKYDVAKLHFYKSMGSNIPLSDAKRQLVIREIEQKLRKSMITNFLKGDFKSVKAVYTLLSDHQYDFKQA